MRSIRKFAQALLCFASVGLPACGGDDGPGETKFEDLFPASSAIGSWTEDSSKGGAGVEVASTDKAVTDLINGDADPFTKRGFASFGRQYYTDGTYSLELRIWQMTDATKSTEVYDALPTEDARYGGDWETLSMGDAARITDRGSSWTLHARKAAYFLEATVGPKDDTSKGSVSSFMSTVISGVK